MICPDQLMQIIKNTTYHKTVFGVGYISRLAYQNDILPPQAIYMTGGWGCVSSISMGLAIGQESQRYLAVDGDGSLFHNLSFLVTLKSLDINNLDIIIVKNGCYESTGGQQIKALANGLSIQDVLNGLGVEQVKEVRHLDDLDINKNAETTRFFVVHSKMATSIPPRIPQTLIAEGFSNENG